MAYGNNTGHDDVFKESHDLIIIKSWSWTYLNEE
jgi:hypothetical protein